MSYRKFAVIAAIFASTSALAQSRQTMQVGERGKNSLVVLEISCVDSDPTHSTCVISGSHIYMTSLKPAYALGEPKNTCYLETSVNAGIIFEHQGQFLVSKEGPSGSICMTQLISSIDFSAHSYVSRKFSDIHTGEFCKAQIDETHNYSQNATSMPLSGLNCTSLEWLPSLWAP